MISCSREGSYIPAYFMPYVAEHLGLEYEVEHMGEGEVASPAMIEEVLENPNPGCTLFVMAMPRTDAACYDKNKAFFTKVLEVRSKCKEEETNRATPSIKRPYTDVWKDEIYWNSDAQLVPLNHDRPLTLYVTGEVFSRHNPKPDEDIVVYRAQNPIGETLTAHFIQGVALQYRDQGMYVMT
jgi:hypothetical protein